MLDAVLLVIRTYDEEKNCNEAYSPKLTLFFFFFLLFLFFFFVVNFVIH